MTTERKASKGGMVYTLTCIRNGRIAWTVEKYVPSGDTPAFFERYPVSGQVRYEIGHEPRYVSRKPRNVLHWMD